MVLTVTCGPFAPLWVAGGALWLVVTVPFTNRIWGLCPVTAGLRDTRAGLQRDSPSLRGQHKGVALSHHPSCAYAWYGDLDLLLAEFKIIWELLY